MGNSLLNVIKFVLAAILIPVVYTTVISFQTHMGSYPRDMVEAFSGGVITCLFIFLFLYQFWAVYEIEQSMTAGIFKFLEPLDRWVAFVLPMFFIITMTLLYFIHRVGDIRGLEDQLMFLSGLFLAMHILVLSQDLQNPEKGITKPAYLLVLACTVVVSLFLAVLMMDLVSDRNTMGRFQKQWFNNTRVSYQTIIDTLLFFK